MVNKTCSHGLPLEKVNNQAVTNVSEVINKRSD